MMTDPANKYRDRLSTEHKMAMDTIAFAFQMLAPHMGQYLNVIAGNNAIESFGPVLSPTLFRDVTGSKSFAMQLKLMEAAVSFINACMDVGEELEKAGYGEN